MEIQKSLKFKEYADEEKKKNTKYKIKLQQYKRHSKTLEKEIETITSNNKDYYIYKKGEIIDDSKHTLKLREEIFKLNEQLDEEKNKTEVFRILVENEKEKIKNYKEKYNKTKKFNDTLLNKIKEKEKNINKGLEDENNLLKKQIVNNENEIDKLKSEIKKLNGEIESYKSKFKLFDNKKKSIIKENKELKLNLSEKEDIIKRNSNKLNEISIKYNEEKDKNQRLSIEIRELFYQNKKLKDDMNIFNVSKKELFGSNITPNFKPGKLLQKKSKMFETILGSKHKINKFDKKLSINKDKKIKNILKKTYTNYMSNSSSKKNVKIIDKPIETKKDFESGNPNKKMKSRKSLIFYLSFL